METVDEVHDKAKQAKKLGFVVGCFVVKKKAPAEVYECLAVAEDTLTAQLHNSSAAPIEVTIETFFVEWRPHKGKVYELLADVEKHSPLVSMAWSLEAVKGCIAAAMRQVMSKPAECVAQLDTFTPSMVRARIAIKANSLVLVAASQRIKRKSVAGSIGLGGYTLADGSTTNLFLAPQVVLPKTDDTTNITWLAPFSGW